MACNMRTFISDLHFMLGGPPEVIPRDIYQWYRDYNKLHVGFDNS